MVSNMFWVACCSQTGTELVQLCKEMGITPDAIVTTNRDRLNPEIYELNAPIFCTSGRPTPDQYGYFFTGANLVTLHGFLYIIPEEVCQAAEKVGCRIYNGHPALLTRYPELKGKDKQEDAFYKKHNYSLIGSVIHKCVAELDAGEIVIAVERPNTATSVEHAYSLLRETSLRSWIMFFDKLLSGNNPWNWDYYITQSIEEVSLYCKHRR